MLLADHLTGRSSFHVGGIGFDGRSDVVSFGADAAVSHRVYERAGMAEDLFLQIGYASRSDGDHPAWLAQRLCHAQPLTEAIACHSMISGHPVIPTLRVIVRVRTEKAFIRADLRRALTSTMRGIRPGWSIADPAAYEIWVLEFQPGRFIAGLRVTSSPDRQRGGRIVQRIAALRPSVAAAMVALAGDPPGRLLDPCCGTGTIVHQASQAGWTATGVDIDAEAVAAARLNTAAAVTHGDARTLPFDDGCFGAWVSNLPFGHRHAVPGEPEVWLQQVLGEAARLVRAGGRIVVMHPQNPRKHLPFTPTGQRRYPIRLLGFDTSIWQITVPPPR